MESNNLLIGRFKNDNLNSENLKELMHFCEERFLHDTAISLNLDNNYYTLFVNQFSRNNKNKTITEMSDKLGFIPETYRGMLGAVYRKFEEDRGLQLQERNKSRQIYQYLWLNNFYDWLNSKEYSLLCRRSNQDRRKIDGKIDRRQNTRRRLITDFKIECVKGKLDKLQDKFDLLTSYRFIIELKMTLIKAVSKYEFRDKLSLNLSNSTQVIEEAILKIRQEVDLQNDRDKRIELLLLLEKIRDTILEKYEVSTDRRRQSNRRNNNQVITLIQMQEAS